MAIPVKRFEFEQIGLAMTSLLANQPVESESERARDQCQSAAVTLLVNLSFSFVSLKFNFIDFCYRQLKLVTVSTLSLHYRHATWYGLSVSNTDFGLFEMIRPYHVVIRI